MADFHDFWDYIGIEVRLTVLDSKEKATLVGFVQGGGIHRLKEHLAGRKGGGPMCRSVPPDVRLWTQQYLDGVIGKQNSQQLKIQEEASIVDLPSSEEGMLSNPFAWQRKKRKSNQEKLHNVHSLPSGEDLDIFADHTDDVNTSPEAAAGCNLAEANSDFLLDEEGTSNENFGKRKSRGGKRTSAIALAAAHDADALMGMGLEKADNAIHVTMGRRL
ncbi:hypothetical protein NC653_035627 [Populus alba x Populus x berolinensis]|uniref:Uncharacterized protein n=1 Tax=Populus alba x Populus x berolinensis TaxID=444605 RepID=A0AAD6LKJ0_9ROSI|nr:hypothetical protein NC653_035627 [Populus alba x Populus x berolinensis]